MRPASGVVTRPTRSTMRGDRSTISGAAAGAKETGERDLSRAAIAGLAEIADFTAGGETTCSSAGQTLPAFGATHHQPPPRDSAPPSGKPTGRSLPLFESLKARRTRRGPAPSSGPAPPGSRPVGS